MTSALSALSLDVKSIAWLGSISISTILLAIHNRKALTDIGDVDDGREFSRPPALYSILQLASRALLATTGVLWLLNDNDAFATGSSALFETATLIYIFLLDTLRVLVFSRSPRQRSALLHHVNCFIILDTVVSALQLAPYVIYTNQRQKLHHDGQIVFAPEQSYSHNWLLLKLAVNCLSVAIAFASPRQWTPPPVSFGLAQRQSSKPSPEQTCSYLSYFFTYTWMSDLVYLGAGRRLVLGDVLPLPEYDEPLLWKEATMEARARFKTTAKTLAYTLRWNIATMILFAALTAVVEFIAPLALYSLLSHLQDPSASNIRPWLWVALLFLGPILRSGAYQQYLFHSTRLMVRIKMCLTQELYAKASRCYETTDSGYLKENPSSGDALTKRSSSGAGKSQEKSGKSDNVTTLMAFDVDNICTSRDFILVCTSSPIEITIGLVFLYHLFGYFSFVALSILLLSFPLAATLSRVMQHFQRKLMKITDRRIAAISEYLSAIRTIKYLGWEHIMAARINDERQQEERQIWYRNISSVAVTVLGDFVPLFGLFLMFAIYTVVFGHQLTAAKAFTSVSIIETLRLQFVWIANVTRFYSQGRVAFSRIDKYMNTEPEIQPPLTGPAAFNTATVRRAIATDTFRLSVDCKFVEGGLNIISGASGSGKSTLLLSLIGETVLESGSVTCPRSVSYASQTPWLMRDTIRSNITMYQDDFDAARYSHVLFACGLLPDLEKMKLSDLTNVGVDGSNLSGGQRQRVCLARAIYAKSSTLILDDVFSALDSTTQKHIWEYVFCDREILQGRTVIMASQFQAAKDNSDLLLHLSIGNGSQEGGSTTTTSDLPRRLLQSHDLKSLPLFDKFYSHLTDEIDSQELADGGIPLPVSISRSRVIEADVNREVAGQKRNPRTLFYQYMFQFGGHTQALLALAFCLVLQLAFFSLPMWLSVWVSSPVAVTSVGYYVTVYGICLLVFLVAAVTAQTYLQWGAWQATHTMHKKLVAAAMWVSIHWYDKNPPGQFINRFSRDVFSLDFAMIDYLRVSIDNVFRFVLRLTAIGAILPIFGVPAVLICLVGLVCAEMYTRTQLSVKSLQSAAQSPIFTFFMESVRGRSVIRSGPGFQQSFSDDLARRIRTYSRTAETQYNLNRWISVRADGCAAIIALATGVLALTRSSDNVSAGQLGFSLTSAIGLGQTILTMVRSMNELEAELNSFYRVREYASLPHEDDVAIKSTDVIDSEACLPAHWPSAGRIEFEDVSIRYALEGPDILHNVSLQVQPGERIAVVGRTGSGKSTLALSLLGFTNITGGKITIDGIDIASLPLHLLRERLTIIPQEPVLFGGDIRFNLDPAGTASCNELADAINSCSSAVESMDAAALDLDTVVASQGSNFSVGQRQVLSLARATVRQSQVVILDEATASIDYQSDIAIQKVLRTTFQGRTVIAIVHRLSTIMDYDRVIVMDAGEIREMGSPVQLYHQCSDDGNPTLFRKMVEQSIEHGRGSEWTEEKIQLLEALKPMA